MSPRGSPKSRGGAKPSKPGPQYAQLSNSTTKTQGSTQDRSQYDHLSTKMTLVKSVDDVLTSANGVGAASHAVGVVTGNSHHPPRGVLGSRSFDAAEVLDTRVGWSDSKSHKGRGFIPRDSLTSNSSSRNSSHRLEHDRDLPLSVVSRYRDPLPTAHSNNPTHQWVLDSLASTQVTPPRSHSQPEAVLAPSSLIPPPASSHSQPPHHPPRSKLQHNGHVTGHMTSTSSHRPPHSRHRGDPRRGQGSSKRRSHGKAKHILSNDSIFQSPQLNQNMPRVNGIHSPRSHGDRNGGVTPREPQELSQWAMLSSGGSISSSCHRQQHSLDETQLYVNLREAAALMSEGSQVSGRGTPTFIREVR